MRIIFSVLIFCLIIAPNSLASEVDPVKSDLNIFQARGLKKEHCYRELSALTCKDKCILSLFPKTSAQLDLRVSKISKRDLKKMGHLFLAKFKVLTDGASEAEILNLESIDFNDFKKQINQAAGLLQPTACP